MDSRFYDYVYQTSQKKWASSMNQGLWFILTFRYAIIPVPSVEKAFHSTFNFTGTYLNNPIITLVWVYIWSPYSAPLICLYSC